MKQNKNTVILLILLAMIFTLLTSVFAHAENAAPSVSARAAVLYEPITGSILYQKNMDERLPMASTTKIMTALIAIERCELDELVEIPKEAVGIEGSSVYLKEGDSLTVRDLLYSVLLQSANDAATALAIKIGGDIKGFSDIMNEKAYLLGLENTHFDNPHGLDSEEHYTSAKDLALLSAAALDNDIFRKITSTYKYSFPIADTQRTVVNHNKMLKRYDGVIGVKTGFTKRCGRCLVSAAERDGLRLIAVTLNAPDDWSDHTRLLDHGFDTLEAIDIRSLTEVDFTLPVIGGKQQTLALSVPVEQLTPIIKYKAENSFEVKLTLKQYACAPIKAGDKYGSIKIYNNRELIRTLDILACENIDKAAEKKRFLWF